MKWVQKSIDAYEGSLLRFIVDDKGAGLLMAFGLPPFMPVLSLSLSLSALKSPFALLKTFAPKTRGARMVSSHLKSRSLSSFGST